MGEHVIVTGRFVVKAFAANLASEFAFHSVLVQRVHSDGKAGELSDGNARWAWPWRRQSERLDFNPCHFF